MNRTKPRLSKRKSMRQRYRENVNALEIVARVEKAMAQTNLLFCAVLAQLGGTVTVVQGTLDQCVQNFGKLGFEMKASEAVKGEYVITLLTGEPEAPSTAAHTEMPALVITG